MTDALDLDRDLPTSEDDVAALGRARRLPPDDWPAAIQRLHDALPPRHGSPDAPPPPAARRSSSELA